ncbi:MAG TPA: 1-(5-phosphoribosyl)-5-[(5-phosphoribosylamino)methylideneamino]imidazole-4-carboxamide isomerase [Thermomicrobiales bacterium]|nr:1-(5-phosphoribosyl)-5-[(5-phosphoribosylamino)methylideneamino]imidazole-4-carboxamide isomerase [Thermomicrobiales bacterium]
MLVIPAIDLRGGRCVRLYQGDYDRETVYDDDPLAVARRWEEAGARLIHVVDLDGARSGVASQREIIRAMAAGLDVPLQVGGGVRTVEDAAELLDGGVARVIIGTAAVRDPQLVSALIARYGPERVIVGIDARGGLVATDGWRETSQTPAERLIDEMAARGVERIVYTDIERDGTLTAPNFEAVAAVAGRGPAVIASGGVARRADLDRLAAIPGVEAAIVGQALYTGNLTLGPGEWEWSANGGGEGDPA